MTMFTKPKKDQYVVNDFIEATRSIINKDSCKKATTILGELASVNVCKGINAIIYDTERNQKEERAIKAIQGVLSFLEYEFDYELLKLCIIHSNLLNLSDTKRLCFLYENTEEDYGLCPVRSRFLYEQILNKSQEESNRMNRM